VEALIHNCKRESIVVLRRAVNETFPIVPFTHGPPLFVALCEPGWEEPLAVELGEEFSAGQITRAPGCVTIRDLGSFAEATRPALAWCRQALPFAELLTAPSINQWTETLGQQIVSALRDEQGPWTVLLGPMVPESNAVSLRRIALIEQALREWLKRKQKRLLKTWRSPGSTWSEIGVLLQVAWIDASTAYVSHLSAAAAHEARAALSSFPAGMPTIASDLEAPARAFAKLSEALQRMGRGIKTGEACVDLGASPGSWTWVALQQHGHVTAVDRSPLRADLMRSSHVRFVKGDAFAFEPSQTVDWLLCDVAAFPERTLDLLRHWLEQRWCRNFVVTTKFRGSEGYHLLPNYKDMLRASGYEYQLRRLNANKNEMTSMGYLP
jgi:23S rRNA (cytidine2498-2'-O)-methyltransferase